MSLKAPACLFYWNDFLTDVSEWPLEAVGAYMRLLCHAWVNKSIPNNVVQLAWLAHAEQESFSELWKVFICAKFIENDDGRLINPRMEEEREKQEVRRLQRVMAGRASGRARAVDVQMESNGRSSPVATKSEQRKEKKKLEKRKKQTEEEKKIEEAFVKFWIEYPRKENRIRAEYYWKGLFHETPRTKRLELYQEIMKGLRTQKASPKWMEENGRFIPHPSSWINGRRWRDEGVSMKDLEKSKEDADAERFRAMEEGAARRRAERKQQERRKR